MPLPDRQAIVMGGSLGGLTSALILRDAGWAVDVYERSPRPLMGLGAGIVAHPASVRYLVERTASDLGSMTAAARSVRYLDHDGSVIEELPASYRFTSYYALYRDLLDAFDEGRYHLGHEVRGFERDADGVTVALADGTRRRCELLVCADGIRSTGRAELLPEVRPEYAGYVAWRGVISEEELSPEAFALVEEAIAYYLRPSSHMLTYPIPSVDGSVERGRRLINWIWYHNIPAGPELDDLMTDRDGRRQTVSIAPGAAQGRHVADVKRVAAETLAPPLAEMVRKTAEPFVQAIVDVAPQRLAFDRVCLLGDAATVLRPHVAVGTAKAAEAAWRLGAAIEATDHDVPAALALWEPDQLALERSALARTREAGERSQFANTWRIGDPLPFGLYEEGDSAIDLGPGPSPVPAG